MPFNPGDRVRVLSRGDHRANIGEIVTIVRSADPEIFGDFAMTTVERDNGIEFEQFTTRFELAEPLVAERFILWNAAGHYHNVEGRHSYTHDEAVTIAREALTIDGTRVLHLVPLRSVHVFQR